MYAVGETLGVLPGQTQIGGRDVFVRKYDSIGNEMWTRQFGSAVGDQARGVTIDRDDNLYVVGMVDGVLPGQTNVGVGDSYIRKYDSAGEELWTRQFGTIKRDELLGVASDESGYVYVVGQVYASALPGQTRITTLSEPVPGLIVGGYDAFIRKYSSAGDEILTLQFGSAGSDKATGVAVFDSAAVYVVGQTSEDLPGQTNLAGISRGQVFQSRLWA